MRSALTTHINEISASIWAFSPTTSDWLNSMIRVAKSSSALAAMKNEATKRNLIIITRNEHIFSYTENVHWMLDDDKWTNDIAIIVVVDSDASAFFSFSALVRFCQWEFLCATKRRNKKYREPYNIKSDTFAHAKYLRLFRYSLFVWRSTYI